MQVCIYQGVSVDFCIVQRGVKLYIHATRTNKDLIQAMYCRYRRKTQEILKIITAIQDQASILSPIKHGSTHISQLKQHLFKEPKEIGVKGVKELISNAPDWTISFFLTFSFKFTGLPLLSLSLFLSLSPFPPSSGSAIAQLHPLFQTANIMGM